MDDRGVMLTFAAVLATRVDQGLPEGFYAKAAGPFVALYTGEQELQRDIDVTLALAFADSFAGAAESAALQVLSDFQTDVIEELWTAWPIAEGPTAPADPYAKVSAEGVLTLGYRYADLAVIDLAPIDLMALEPSDGLG